jgi:hypothetical protein
MRVLDLRRRRVGTVAVRPRPLGWLAGVAGRPAARPRHRPLKHRLSGADAHDLRRLCAGAGGGAQVAARVDRGRDGGRERDPAAGAAADLPGRVRLPGVCAHGRPARPRPVHALCRRSASRPGVPVRRLALSELAIRSAVYAPQLHLCAAGAGRRAVGVQGARRACEPRRGRVDRARGRAHGPLSHVGGGVRRPEPSDAGAS